MNLYASLHLKSDDRPEVRDHSGADPWVKVGYTTDFFCEDADTAGRIATAFRELEARMRAAANLPDPDQLELEPVDHTGDPCPCGEPECNRPFGHPVEDVNEEARRRVG